jgi:16S rRNA (uracil1498-N3)-methyltransferase
LNIILFEPGEIGIPLGARDPRAEHVLAVLGRKEGDAFDAGIINGARGRATVTRISDAGVEFAFEAVAGPDPSDPIAVLVALPRPQTARRILGEAAALGVARIRFFAAEKGEPGYASSTLWKSGEWRRRLVDGASQAFSTGIPEVAHDASLESSLAALGGEGRRVALDNYEAPSRLGPLGGSRPLALAFGPERGWSAAERSCLRAAGFGLAHLGSRVLRLETAVIAALTLAKTPP